MITIKITPRQNLQYQTMFQGIADATGTSDIFQSLYATLHKAGQLKAEKQHLAEQFPSMRAPLAAARANLKSDPDKLKMQWVAAYLECLVAPNHADALVAFKKICEIAKEQLPTLIADVKSLEGVLPSDLDIGLEILKAGLTIIGLLAALAAYSACVLSGHDGVPFSSGEIAHLVVAAVVTTVCTTSVGTVATLNVMQGFSRDTKVSDSLSAFAQALPSLEDLVEQRCLDRVARMDRESLQKLLNDQLDQVELLHNAASDMGPAGKLPQKVAAFQLRFITKVIDRQTAAAESDRSPESAGIPASSATPGPTPPEPIMPAQTLPAPSAPPEEWLMPGSAEALRFESLKKKNDELAESGEAHRRELQQKLVNEAKTRREQLRPASPKLAEHDSLPSSMPISS